MIKKLNTDQWIGKISHRFLKRRWSMMEEEVEAPLQVLRWFKRRVQRWHRALPHPGLLNRWQRHTAAHQPHPVWIAC